MSSTAPSISAGSLTYSKSGVEKWTDPLNGKQYDVPTWAAMQAASPTLHLRWCGAVLQQMWTVTQYEGGKPSAVVTEWRDVPRIEAAGV